MRIELVGVTKAYGAVVANREVDFDIEGGDIHVLVGENGAGKSTLMNVLFGHVQPDAGRILVDGKETVLTGPADAIALGIGMVHQHFSLVPNLTVAQNIALGDRQERGPRLRMQEIEERVALRADELGIELDVRARIEDLPVDIQQKVEIVKALHRGAKALILDEPTALLGPQQIATLLELLQRYRDDGVAIALVTHKMLEVSEVADRVTVLRRGEVVHRARRGEFDMASLALAMTGSDLRMPTNRRTPPQSDRPVLRLDRLRVVDRDDADKVRLDGVSLVLRPGEIVGVAGVEGNGQRELVDALTGVGPVADGRISLAEADVTDEHPRVRRAQGLGVVPEDRHAWGLVLDMDLAENLGLNDVPAGRFSRFGVVSERAIHDHADALLAEYDVRPPDRTLRANALSGGNQQKVVLARELARQPMVLITDNPTWGLDVGATAFVRDRLLAARAAGVGILLLSMDLDELLQLSDRLVVLYRGQVTLEADIGDVTVERIGLAMNGQAA